MNRIDNRTTLCIKNIPNKYNQPYLVYYIAQKFNGKFDFFYLPWDNNQKANFG